MAPLLHLNGFHLYECFLAGYHNLSSRRKQINDINVFPVPDGDTGTNMVSTFRSILDVGKVSRSLSRTMASMADKALAGARGNSGIILAQFLNSLSRSFGDRDEISTREFGQALHQAALATYGALENPREGTLLTLLRVWSEEMQQLATAVTDFRDLFIRCSDSARKALSDTTHQLEALLKANVVDAGASGIMAFIDGVGHMIQSGQRPARNRSQEQDPELSGPDDHHIHDISVPLPFRYCTEALLTDTSNSAEYFRALLSDHGDSLVVSVGQSRTRIHLHTNDPPAVFALLRTRGLIREQKVDDMLLQRAVAHNPAGTTAIITDSIADIPPDMAEKLQIHVIPQKILWNNEEYLDRLTIRGENLYPLLDSREEHPGTSAPDKARVSQIFQWLSTHYRAIVAIPVGKALSGTWQVMENAASELRKTGYPVTVVDSCCNSAAQGLLVIGAAENAAKGMPPAEILLNLQKSKERARIYVSVDTMTYMVRGGRISSFKGQMASLTHIRPIVSLDKTGKGIAFGATFSSRGSQKKLLDLVIKNRDSISRLAIVHAGAPERAKSLAESVYSSTGIQPLFIEEISPAVGLHAGPGALAVAWI